MSTKFKKLNFVIFTTILLMTPTPAWNLPWDKDMRNQPSVKPQETRVDTNESSIPVSGAELFPVPADMTQLVHDRLEAGKVPNPVPITGKSINLGKHLYDLHCSVCHGEQGFGDGPVGKKYVPDPMNLTIDYVQTQPDGQLFYTISHGSIAMPYYRDSIRSEDRWHVINYIKAVLGKKNQ